MQGKRRLLTPQLAVGPRSRLQPGIPDLSWLVSNDLPLWISLAPEPRGASKEAHNHWASSNQAQLTRIWVVTPPAPLQFKMRPRLSFEVLASLWTVLPRFSARTFADYQSALSACLL